MSYSSSSSPSSPSLVRIGAGTAIKIGFFGALGATLFSLVLSAIIGVVVFVLVLLGVSLGPLLQFPR
jgi:hypothetical protein